LADPLSRGTEPSSLGMGFTTANSFTRDTAPSILRELSTLLDPSIEIMEEAELLNRWARYTVRPFGDVRELLILISMGRTRINNQGWIGMGSGE